MCFVVAQFYKFLRLLNLLFDINPVVFLPTLLIISLLQMFIEFYRDMFRLLYCLKLILVVHCP